MNYDDSLVKLMSLIDLERTDLSGPRQKTIYDLSRVETFLSYLDNPELDVSCIHVAGTKGKGSVSAICESVLRATGLKTGFFSSPHLHSFTERIRINGQPIDKSKFGEYFELLWIHHEKWSENISKTKLTLFECITVLAFYIFSKESVDVSVIEVGLGGRLDATNVVQPEVCVITALGYDHMNILGSDIESITREKAGIIKPNTPVVVSPQTYDVINVIKGVCDETDSCLINISHTSSSSLIEIDNTWQHILVDSPVYVGELRTPLIGDHQAENVLTSLGAVNELKRKGWPIEREHIENGVSSVSWPCRMEVIEIESQQIVLDGAHTYESIKLVMDSVTKLFKYNKFGVLLGLSKDKDIDGICNLISSYDPDYIKLIKSRHPKALDPECIRKNFTECRNSITVADSIQDAIETIRNDLGAGDLILSIGSLFSCAEVREYLLCIESEVY